MLLAIVYEANTSPEVFSPSLVPELADVPTSLSGLSTVTRFDHFCAAAKRTIPALGRYQSRIFIR